MRLVTKGLHSMIYKINSNFCYSYSKDYTYIKEMSYIHTAIWCNDTSQFFKTFFETIRSKKSYTKYPEKRKQWQDELKQFKGIQGQMALGLN